MDLYLHDCIFDGSSLMENIQKTLRTYIVGFILSLILTFLAYTLVVTYHQNFTQPLIIAIILLIAFLQLFVQMMFFLHLGSKGSGWNTIFFVLTFIAVATVIVASIWIMNHLNYNMTPTQQNQYIQQQSSF